MNIIQTNLDPVVIIEPTVYKDNRGYFFESYSEEEFSNKVTSRKFVQDNESYSKYGVLRGIHYQIGEHAQSKLVRCVDGAVLDVIVDLRKGSPTFAKHISVLLSGENKKQVFIPRGFGHGFVTLTQHAILQYKCDNFYNKEASRGIAWNDPDLDIPWKVACDNIILSENDMNNPKLSEVDWLFDYNTNYYTL